MSDLISIFIPIFGTPLGLAGSSAMYVLSIALAFYISFALTSQTRNAFLGIAVFVAVLAIESLFGMFPLWILLFPISIIILLGVHFKRSHG